MALVDYGSSSGSESDTTDETTPTPAILKGNLLGILSVLPKNLKPGRPALPTALSLLGAKQPKRSTDDEDEDDATDNPALHGGRIRSFKHERGNWATFVYVPADSCVEQLEDFQTEAIEMLATDLELQMNESLHLSLSKTVVLQYHQIDEFTKSLQQALQSCSGFNSNLHLLEVYTNEEKTRTFLAVKLDAAFTTKMTTLLQSVDLVMRDYRLPKFYEKPSFHVSLLWCVGDYQELLNSKLEKLQQLLDDHDTLKLPVKQVLCKCGNKDFIYKLK